MIKNDKDELYVGVSENLQYRLREHNTKRGSVFTKSGDFKIVFQEKYSSLAEARRREIQIKKWRRNKKEVLIDRQKRGLTTKI
jgi:putative endonuclease